MPSESDGMLPSMRDGDVLPDGRLLIEHKPLNMPLEAKRATRTMREAGYYFRSGTFVMRVALVNGVPGFPV